MRTYFIQHPIQGAWTDSGSKTFGKSGGMEWQTQPDGSVRVVFWDGER